MTTYQEIKKVNESSQFIFNTGTKCENMKQKLCKKIGQAFFNPSGIYHSNFEMKDSRNKENVEHIKNLDGPNFTNHDYIKRSYFKKLHYEDNPYKPGEIHLSDEEQDVTFTQTAHRNGPYIMEENDSLNKKIISIINSSGTKNEDVSEGKFFVILLF